MNITIFIRTNKGITVSKEGEVFLGYARQVLEQASLLEEKYCGKQHGKRQFCISTQHYSFAVNAFVDLIKEFGGEIKSDCAASLTVPFSAVATTYLSCCKVISPPLFRYILII